jgi:hypothetical protein
MKRFFCLGVAALVCLCFAAAVAAEDAVKAKPKMISGKILQVDCEKGAVTVSEVQDLKSKEKLPNVVLKLNDKTTLRNVAECKEISTGTGVYAAYEEGDKENQATELIFQVKMVSEAFRDKAKRGAYKPTGKVDLK